jgi:hypothetical protein
LKPFEGAEQIMTDTMKLYAFDNSDLMENTNIYPDGNNLVIEGTIMCAMPIRAIVKPAEVRKAFGLMSFKAKLHATKMLFKRSR